MTDPSPHLETLREHAELRGLGPSERFERWAEAFYRATGFMAPGKSLPLEMGGMQEDEDRQKAWDAFVAARSEKLGKALAYAIQAIEERDELLIACKSFVEAYQKSLQLEKTDQALRLCRAAIEKAERTDA